LHRARRKRVPRSASLLALMLNDSTPGDLHERFCDAHAPYQSDKRADQLFWEGAPMSFVKR